MALASNRMVPWVMLALVTTTRSSGKLETVMVGCRVGTLVLEVVEPVAPSPVAAPPPGIWVK